MRILIGLIILVVGLLLCIYYKKITQVISLRIEWAEKYLGSTYYAYFLFGMIGIILGFLITINVISLGFLGI
jgi:hypothetical protein